MSGALERYRVPSRYLLTALDLQVNERLSRFSPSSDERRNSVRMIDRRLTNHRPSSSSEVVERLHCLLEASGHRDSFSPYLRPRRGLWRGRDKPGVSLDGHNGTRNRFDHFWGQRVEVRQRFLEWIRVHPFRELPGLIKADANYVIPAEISDRATQIERLLSGLGDQKLENAICDSLTRLGGLSRRKQTNIESHDGCTGGCNCGRPARCFGSPKRWHLNYESNQARSDGYRYQAQDHTTLENVHFAAYANPYRHSGTQRLGGTT